MVEISTEDIFLIASKFLQSFSATIYMHRKVEPNEIDPDDNEALSYTWNDKSAIKSDLFGERGRASIKNHGDSRSWDRETWVDGVFVDQNMGKAPLKQRDRRERTWRMGRPPGDIVTNLCAFTSAATIASYSTIEGLDPRCVERFKRPPLLEEDPGKNLLLQAGDILGKPSSGILPVTMLVFGASVSTMYHLNHEDQFQDKILVAGMILSFMGGTLVGYNGEAIILYVLPWAILLALSLSAIGHRISRSMKIKLETHECELLA